jgi:hypothetical protein
MSKRGRGGFKQAQERRKEFYGGKERHMFVRVEVDQTQLEGLLASIRSAKATHSPIYGESFRAALPGTDPGVFRMTEVRGIRERGAMAASSMVDPQFGKLTGLSPWQEAGAYYDIGYFDRATRSLLSQIPGMNRTLSMMYQVRAVMRTLRGGGALPSIVPRISGRGGMPGAMGLFGGDPLNPDIPGAGMAGLQTGFMPMIGAALMIARMFGLIHEIEQGIQRLERDRERAIRQQSDISHHEYERWLKTQSSKYRGLKPW